MEVSSCQVLPSGLGWHPYDTFHARLCAGSVGRKENMLRPWAFDIRSYCILAEDQPPFVLRYEEPFLGDFSSVMIKLNGRCLARPQAGFSNDSRNVLCHKNCLEHPIRLQDVIAHVREENYSFLALGRQISQITTAALVLCPYRYSRRTAVSSWRITPEQEIWLGDSEINLYARFTGGLSSDDIFQVKQGNSDDHLHTAHLSLANYIVLCTVFRTHDREWNCLHTARWPQKVLFWT